MLGKQQIKRGNARTIGALAQEHDLLDSLERYSQDEVVQSLDSAELSKLIKQVIIALEKQPIVNFNHHVQGLEISISKKASENSTIYSNLSSINKKVVNNFSKYVSKCFNVSPSRDLAICCKRFTQLNGPYHYQDHHVHNSISFKVDQDSWIFGYSAYLTQSADPQVIVIKITEGELTNDSKLLVKFDTTFSNVEKKDVQGQTNSTASVWLNEPIFLTEKTWYTISFDKPRGTYIYYGSNLIQNPLKFGDGKSVQFKKALCDGYDNTDNVGQFPDLYLY